MATVDTINALYLELLGRPADADGLAYWLGEIESGRQSLAKMVVGFAASSEAQQDIAPIVQLYFTAFGRAPDAGGLQFWVQAKRDGMSLDHIARSFSASPEFAGQHGDDAAGFLAAAYQNALGREPDAEGLAYWSDRLAQGDSQANILLAISNSAEALQHNEAEAQVVLIYHGLEGRAPTQVEIDAALQGTGDVAALLESLAQEIIDGGAGEPGTPGEPQPLPIDYLPNAGTTQNSSDASTAIALGDDYILVGDDEANVLRVYHRDGGAAVAEWSYDEAIGAGGELDLEASALVGNTLYLIGSHGNSKDGDDADNREIMLSVSIEGTGAATTFTFNGLYAGLEADLAAWDAGNGHGLGANYFGLATSSGNGISPEQPSGFAIEGATTSLDDTALWLGFRAPQTDTVTRDMALLVSVENYAELISGEAGAPVFGEPIELNLGGRGIRSIEKAADGSGYIIIAGSAAPSSEALDHNFRLFTWDGNPASEPVELDNDLDALLASTGGSFETLVSPASILAGTEILLLQDNGDTIWAGQTEVSKDLPAADQQFQGNVVTLGNAVTDAAGPSLVAAYPADGTEGAAVDSPFVFTFSEGVARGEGAIVLRDANGGIVETFDVADSAQISFNYNVVTLRPSADLAFETGYSITIEAGAITDHYGNGFAGVSDADPIDLTTSAAPTVLEAGDILFVGGNAEAPDAIAFVLMTDITGGTRIAFTDRDYSATTGFDGVTNEAAFVWTAGRDLKAGTVITIQTDVSGNPIADIGTVQGGAGGVGKSETYYAMQGAVIEGLVDGSAGVITDAGTFLASLTLGGAAGDIPAELTAAGAAMSFTIDPANQTNARYTGSLDATDLAALAASIKDAANWEANYTKAPGFALVDGSLFGAPLVSNASTDGQVVTVTFNQALLAATGDLPAASAFTVRIGETTVSPTAVAIDGAIVTLTLADAIPSGSLVSLAYADPTTGNDAQALQSLAGVDVPSFSALNVVNQAPDDIAPQVEAISMAGETVVPFADLVISFDEVVQKGAGSIVLDNLAGGADIIIDVQSNAVAVNGSSVTIDIGQLLDFGADYTVSVAGGAFTDLVGNAMDSFVSPSFSTVDTAPAYDLLITEVNSNAAGGDFFEIYNHGTNAIDLSGWVYSDSAATFSAGAAFAQGTVIAAGDTLVVALAGTDADLAAFRLAWNLPDTTAVVSVDGAGLGGGSGDAVVLFDADGFLADAFSYTAATITASDGSTIASSNGLSGSGHVGLAFGGSAKSSAVWDGVSVEDPTYQVAVFGQGGAYAQPGDDSAIGSPGAFQLLG